MATTITADRATRGIICLSALVSGVHLKLPVDVPLMDPHAQHVGLHKRTVSRTATRWIQAADERRPARSSPRRHMAGGLGSAGDTTSPVNSYWSPSIFESFVFLDVQPCSSRTSTERCGPKSAVSWRSSRAIVWVSETRAESGRKCTVVPVLPSSGIGVRSVIGMPCS